MENQIVSNEVFGARLTELIESSAETTYTLAEKLSLSPGTISRYANGKMAPKLPTLFMLASLFNVNPFWLMGYDSPKYPTNQNSPFTQPSPAMAAHLLEKIPFLATLKDFCAITGKDFTSILRYYQDPANNASLENLLFYGSPKLNDRLVLERILGCDVETAVRMIHPDPEKYLPLCLSRQEIRMILAYRESASEDEPNISLEKNQVI